MIGKKAGRKLADAVVEARDEALIEIGREAALRQEARAGQARRRSVERMAIAAIATGAALTAGAVALKRRRTRKQVEPVILSGKEETPE